MNIQIALLPSDMKSQNLSDSVCVMLDIFRASSSMVTAFQQGCSEIYPVSSIEEARGLAATLDRAVLAGERKSVRIEGFDLGNSPREFTEEKVADRPIVMTTTNGTRAILATAGSYCSFIGAFLNADVLCKKIESINKDVWIVCAGTEGIFSLEDALCAGMLAQRLSKNTERPLNDTVQAMILLYEQAKDTLLKVAGMSRNGQRLFEIGLEADVSYCLQKDMLDVVPVFSGGRIFLPTFEEMCGSFTGRGNENTVS